MQNFVEWLASLSAEGETALVVKQIPKKKGGELQFHGDGALVCTWPAFLPEKWKETDEAAWYGNTASFIIDRFNKGQPSASGANCEFVATLVLDDVGEKATRPALEPSWKMQTSELSEQWGYAFDGVDNQPTKAEFSAAIIAIAEAGFTDRGAINPVRNFRLPGSVNLKPGRNKFKSKLIDWHPERRFTLQQICTALNVTPAEAATAQHRSTQLVDDGKDEVVQWLIKEGQVLDRPNSSGWMGVQCPNAEAHTNGDPMGRYNPVHRSYSCLHSHCQDWNSERYLNWIAEEGGPAVQSGIRPELLSEAMSRVMHLLEAERAAKGSPFSAEHDADQLVAEALERAQARDAGRLERGQWYEHFAYVRSTDSYFNLDFRTMWSRKAFDATYRHLDCRSKHGKRPKVQASVKFDEDRVDVGASVIEALVYSPGDGVLVEREGILHGNTWRNMRPAGTEGDVTPWLDLWRKLVPVEFEREHILDVLAYKLQNPKGKVNHAMLIAGGHGIGKDTALAPFLWAIGGSMHANVALVRNEDIASGWGYVLKSEVILYNELRQSEAKDRRALENHLKPIIAAPPETIMANIKHEAPVQVVNRMLVIAYSNERAAIALPSEDRRWFVVWSEAGKMGEREAKRLWDWYKLRGGFEAIAGYLHRRDVSHFLPAAPPPLTDAKGVMIVDARSSAEEYLIDLIESRAGEFAAGFVAAPLHKLVDRLQAGFSGKLYMGALMHSLKEAGWTDCGRVHSREHMAPKRVFCAPDVRERMSNTELRAAVAASEAPVPSVRLVK